MTNVRYGIELQRLDGRFHTPVVYSIPAETPPATELETLLDTLSTKIGARCIEMSPGRWAVHLTQVDQVWSIRIVSVGDPGETARMAVTLYDQDGNELDSLGEAS
jgi:hypothetical protein